MLMLSVLVLDPALPFVNATSKKAPILFPFKPASVLTFFVSAFAHAPAVA
jgi:hypothetical protein